MKITDLAKLSTAALALGLFSAAGTGCESMGNDDSAMEEGEKAMDATGDMVETGVNETGEMVEDTGEAMQ